MDAKEIDRQIREMEQFGEFWAEPIKALQSEAVKLRAENESLKADAVKWDEWRERVAAEFFQSDRFGMNDIWIAITALIRQRDEAREDRDRIHLEALNPADVAVKVLALTARAEAAERDSLADAGRLNGEVIRLNLDLDDANAKAARYLKSAKDCGEWLFRIYSALRLTENPTLKEVVEKCEETAERSKAAEKARDEAVKHYHAAIELAEVQKYATLLDERDALAGRLDAVEKERDEALKRLETITLWSDDAANDAAEIASGLERQNAAMREALEAAPHSTECRSEAELCDESCPRNACQHSDRSCNCWKSRALNPPATP